MVARVIRILGALRVEIDGTALPIASATQRRLLAVLLAQPNVVVSVDRLADAVWDGNPPASARASLQTYLYRLRSAIGDEVILTRPPGYLLDSATFTCDADQFESMAQKARTTEAGECIELSERALALWNGNAFAEFQDNFSCRPAALRLEEMRLALMERRIEALLQAGEADRAIVESEALCATEPLREVAHAHFLRALAAQGRMPEALRVFDGFRKHLAEETGLAPSSSLQALAQDLIAQTNRDVQALEEQHIALPERTAFINVGEAVQSTTSPLARRVESSPSSNSIQDGSQPMVGAVMRVRLVLAPTAVEFASSNRSANPNSVATQIESPLRYELARRAELLLREVVRNGGGSTQTRSGEVTNSWFRSAEDAVLAGIELQQTMAKDQHRHGDASVGQACIGISLGEFAITTIQDVGWAIERTISGGAVAEASWLAQQSGPGSILVSAQIESTIALIDGIAFLDAQTEESESFGSARCFTVDWGRFPDLANRLGMPKRLSLRPGGLVGRETMLEPLLNCLDRAEQGEPSLVSLIGAPGIGKTSLAAAFAEKAVARGCAVLFGSCRRDPHLPFQALGAALDDLVRRHPGGSRILGPYRRELAGLVSARGMASETEIGSLAHEELLDGREVRTHSSTATHEAVSLGLPTGDPQSRRVLTFDAVTQVLCSLSNQLPVVLILDDLHWADAATVELLEELLAGIKGQRILVLVGLREYESVANTRLAQLYQSVASLIPSRRISVQGISVDAVATFVRQVHGSAGLGVAESIHARTGGNPFLVGELLASTTSPTDRTTQSEALSARLVDALAGRLGTVSEGCRKLLSVAAVAGSEFDPVVVAGAVDTAQDEVFDLFEEAISSGNLRERTGEELRLGFDHELLRESLLAEMTQLRRTRYHRDIGLSIERRHPSVRPADLPDLARHFSQAATLGESGRACTYNTLAAERSLLTNGDVQAIGYFRSALEFSDEEVSRAEIMVGLGEALRRRGDRSYRGVLSDAASIADSNHAVGLLSKAVLTDYRGTFGIAFEVDEPRVKRLRRAIDRLEGGPPATMARLLAALSVELVWSPAWEESLALSNRALALARSLQPPQRVSGERVLNERVLNERVLNERVLNERVLNERVLNERVSNERVSLIEANTSLGKLGEATEPELVLAEVLQLRQWVVFHPLDQRVAETVELGELTAANSDQSAQFEFAAHATFTYLRAGDPVRLEQSLELARWLARRIDRPATEWMLALRESAPAMLACRFSEAATLIARSFELGTQTSQPDAFLQRSVQTFWLEFESVDVETQRADMGKLVNFVDKMPALSWPSLAFRCADLGMLKESEALFLRVRAASPELPRDQVWLWNTCQMASLAIRFAPELREVYLKSLLAHCGQIANTVFASVGAVDRYVGQLRASLGEHEVAAHDFAKAIALAERMSAPSWKARAQLDLADLLDSVSQPDAAALLRSQAGEVAAAVGLPVVLYRAQSATGLQ
jgi:DNA-binding SARP family transcriptional activator